MTTNRDAVLTYIVQAGVGGLLIYAALMKIGQIPMFALVLQRTLPGFRRLSTPDLFLAANAVIFVELFVGLSLILFFLSRWMRWVAVSLFGAFSLVLISMLVRNIPMSCGCLGISPSGWSGRGEIMFGVIRNVFLIGLLIVVARHARSARAPNGDGSANPMPIQA